MTDPAEQFHQIRGVGPNNEQKGLKIEAPLRIKPPCGDKMRPPNAR
jgi:hypothetical protein